MKNAFASVLILFVWSFSLCAATGDTIKVKAHDKKAMTWYGNYDTVAVFPSATKKYNKIIMHYTLGCPTTGCSQWDYTTQIFLMKKTGAIDSTLKLVPNFTVNNNAVDTFVYSNLPTVKTVFNSSAKTTDTIPADSSFVRLFSDTTQPYFQTDSFYTWQANYYNYIFDSTGAKTDSFFVQATDTKVVYKTSVYEKFDVLERYELARVITPYGGYYNKSWTNTFRFDVTDFAPLLHDTVLLRAFYNGWSSGFTVTLDFDLVEGTPAREVKTVRNVYNGDFGYGSATNPLENQLVQKSFALSAAETQAKFRYTATGHGFGTDNTDNCAEFCNKTYDVMANNSIVATQNVWRDDCGMNPLWHQSGTWLLDRANWCPGDKGLTHEFELTPVLSGSNLLLQVVPEAYEDLDPAGFNPIYTIQSQVVTYGANNFGLDASVEDVIAPNKHDAYKRFNPICANPKVVIKNNGSQALTSARIYYGMEGKELFFHDWTGNLAFDRTETVSLPYRVISDSTHLVFKVWIAKANGAADEYRWNDTLRVLADVVPRYDSVFNFVLKTNNDFTENTWNLHDDEGNLWYENGTLAANKVYTETFVLATGCYQFELNDAGKDGLSFFANQSTSGTGYARFTRYPSNANFKTFEPDFGTQISQRFIVGNPNIFVPSAVGEVAVLKELNVFPNPASTLFTAAVSFDKPTAVTVALVNVFGQEIQQVFTGTAAQLVLPIEVEGVAAGMYLLQVKGEGFTEVKRVLVKH
jgi:hypothetical protein